MREKLVGLDGAGVRGGGDTCWVRVRIFLNVNWYDLLQDPMQGGKSRETKNELKIFWPELLGKLNIY